MHRSYWLRDEHKNPLAIIVSTEIEDGDHAKFVRFAISIHNPSDTFDRQRGRAIAEGRLAKATGDYVYTVQFGKLIKQDIMDSIAHDPHLPMRVRRAAANWKPKEPATFGPAHPQVE